MSLGLSIHIDGGSRGNPGPAAAGVVIRRLGSNDLLHEAGYFLGTLTNNVAEYHGLLRALQLAVAMGAGELRIHSDSELMVRQMNGQYRVKSADLLPLFEQAQTLLLRFGSWQLTHVPREKNQRADELANLAIDRRRDVVIRSALGAPATPAPPPEAADADADAPAKGVPTRRPRQLPLLPPTPASPSAAPPDAADCPRWAVQFVEQPGAACPALSAAGESFLFGPRTPDGMCVYAAAAALSAGLLGQRSGHPGPRETICPRCGAKIRIAPVD